MERSRERYEGDGGRQREMEDDRRRWRIWREMGGDRGGRGRWEGGKWRRWGTKRE